MTDLFFLRKSNLFFFINCSIHNYSSLNGEFYCVSHYQQLFKGKGNFDEASTLEQRKDQWLPKNKGTDETDSIITPKLKKSNSNLSKGFKDYSTGVDKSPAKELQSSSIPEAKRKLKMSWPPEKNSIGFESVPQTIMKNDMREIRRYSTNSPRVPESNTPKLNPSIEVKDKVKTLAKSFLLGDTKQLKMARPNFTTEKFSSERPKFQSDTPLPSVECATTATNHKRDLKHAVPISKPAIDFTSTNLDNDTSKAKKFVHFGQGINAGKHRPSSKLAEEQKELDKNSKPQDLRHIRDKNKMPVEVSKEIGQSKLHKATPEMNPEKQTTSTPFKKSECKVESGKCLLKTDIVEGNRDTERADEIQNFNDSADKAFNHQEQSEIVHTILTDHVRAAKTKSPTALHGSAAKPNGESIHSIRNQLKKTESLNTRVNGDGQRKPLTKINPVKVSANAENAEKTNVKVGTRSAGINALSKLFTSGGNDKANKTEPKDAQKPELKKPGGGLLGRLLYSSEKDTTKNAKQNEKISKTETDKSKTDEREATSTEVSLQEQEPGKKTIKSQVQPQEQEAAQHIGEQSEVSSLQQGSKQKTEEMFQELPHEFKTREQPVDMSQAPPQEQLAQEEMFKNPNVPSWGHQADEQTVEKSKVQSLELDSAQQRKEMSEVLPQDSKEQTTETSLLPPPQDKEGDDQTVEWTLEHSQEQQLMEEITESKALDSDTDTSEPSSVPSSPTIDVEVCKSEEQQTNEHGKNDTLSVVEGPSMVPVVDQEPVQSVDPNGMDGLSIQSSDDAFKESETAVFVDHQANQILDDEFDGKPVELLDGPAVEATELFGEELSDPNQEPLDHSSVNMDLLESQETTMDMFSSPPGDTAFSKTSSGGSLDLQASENEVTLGFMDELIAPTSTPSHQDDVQSSNPFGTSDQIGEEKLNEPDFDIFASNNTMFIQSPSVDVSSEAGEPQNQPSAFTEDIFGDAFLSSQEVSTLPPSNPSAFNSLSDLLVPDMSFSASPSDQGDPFTDDFFGSAPQLLPVAQSSDMSLFMDGLLVSDNSSTQKAAENAASDNSWMDDLLG